MKILNEKASGEEKMEDADKFEVRLFQSDNRLCV